jgi:UDP-xylose/UDP-N-acetylglucosamine transporter B4
MATETPSNILRKRTAADMTVVQNSVRRDSTPRELANGDLERGSGPSIAQHIAKLMAHEVGPSLLTVGVMLSLIFGGCCSNVGYAYQHLPPTNELSHTDQITY